MHHQHLGLSVQGFSFQNERFESAIPNRKVGNERPIHNNYCGGQERSKARPLRKKPVRHTKKMNLVCELTRFSVDKVVLFSKLGLFSSNPSLLSLLDSDIRSSVSFSAFSGFVEALSSSEFVITEANCAGLTLLSEEFGFAALSDACKKFSASHGRESGQDFGSLMSEVVSLRETNLHQKSRFGF
jgi:hypothetical protein